MTKRRRFGSIRKLPSGRWQASYSRPDGRRVTADRTFHGKEDGEAWLTDRRRELNEAAWNPAAARRPERTTFGVYATKWLAHRGVKPATVEFYERIQTKYLLPAFGDRQLAAITPQDIREWHSSLLPNNPTMKKHCYSHLRTILSTAVEDELIDSNPCRIRGAGQASRVREILPVEASKFGVLAAGMPDRLQMAVLLASWCALRFGEVTELRRHDIDLSKEVIRVRRGVVRIKGRYVVGEPKSKAGIRDVHLPPRQVEKLEQHLAEHVAPGSDALLFPASPGGTQHLSPASMYRHWNKARTEAGLPHLRFHDLRHSGLESAALAAQTGAATWTDVMARGGHSNYSTSMRYQHPSQARDREIAALMEKQADG